MSGGLLLLTITAILTYCGLIQRVLDRMHMTDRQALVLIGAMIVGTFMPEIRLGSVAVNIGGALIPFAVCIYLMLKADSSKERWRSVIGIAVTGAAIYGISTLLPDEAETMRLDPIWLYGICGGITSWLIGRSRRGAFICGVTGVLLADAVSAIIAWNKGYSAQLHLGGGGVADACVISGISAVLLCEILGEAIEKIVRVMERKAKRT